MPTFEVSRAFNVKFNIMCLFYGLMPRNPFYTSNGAIRVYCQCPVKLTSSLIVNSSAQIETGYGATVSHSLINIKPHFYDQYSACCSVCMFCWFIRYRKASKEKQRKAEYAQAQKMADVESQKPVKMRQKRPRR